MKKTGKILALLLIITTIFSSCSKEGEEVDDAIQSEFTVSVGLLGGYSKYISLYTNAAYEHETPAAFRPLKSGSVVQLEVKVAQNSYGSGALLCMRKNGTNTSLSIDIPAGETGYFVVNDNVPVEKSDEINLFLDATENSSSQLLQFTARVVTE